MSFDSLRAQLTRVGYSRLIFGCFWLVLFGYWSLYVHKLDLRLVWLVLFGALIIIHRRQTRKAYWLWYASLLLAYQGVSLFMDSLETRVHSTELLQLEQWLFSGIPSQWLQSHWHVGPLFYWYDYLLASFYNIFYVFSIGSAVWLWWRQPDKFRLYTHGFITVTLLGYMIYLIYPAVPPWLAVERGYLTGVTKLLFFLTERATGLNLPSLYQVLGANQIAAFPSLHSAWPWFTFICLWSWYRVKALPFVCVPIGIWVAVVYFGEHYIIDVVAGALLATIVGVLTVWRPNRRRA